MTEANTTSNNFSNVTVGIVNYNGMQVLPETVRAVQHLIHPIHEIIVADNGSTDGSMEWLKQHHPDIRCIGLEYNAGAARARNILLNAATTDYILFLDNDISVEPDSLGILMNIMSSNSNAGICHPEIVDINDPDAYHYNGGSIHYLGALIPRGVPCADRPEFERFDVVSGGAMLVQSAVARTIGGFDDNYFFNWEDGDFSARMTLAAYHCLNVPFAAVRHRGRPRGTSKVFYQVRNRWFFMLKLYSWRTLALAAPMLCLFDISQALLLLNKKSFRDYIRGNLDIIKSLPVVLRKRRAFQPMKKLRDREWLMSGAMYIPSSLGSSKLQRVVERAFYSICGLYWRIIRRFC